MFTFLSKEVQDPGTSAQAESAAGRACKSSVDTDRTSFTSWGSKWAGDTRVNIFVFVILSRYHDKTLLPFQVHFII